MSDKNQIENARFKRIVEIIFKETLGIRLAQNGRTGKYTNYFPTYQLGRDIGIITGEKKRKYGTNKEKIDEPEIYTGALHEFFSKGEDKYFSKTKNLIGKLQQEEYIYNPNGTDIVSKCDSNTISIFNKLILDIWNHYCNQYFLGVKDSKIKAYKIQKETVDSIVEKFIEFRLPAILDFYRDRLPDIEKSLQVKDPNNMYGDIKTEYMWLFKDVIENESFYSLSEDETRVFINTLYAISDMLDTIHHEDSYQINLEILDFFNRIHADNFENISIDDIRKIQGCIYAIAIETTDKSKQGNIKLTDNNNLIRIESGFKPISYKKKVEICVLALKNLLNNKNLKALNDKIRDEVYISLFENRIKKNRTVKISEINDLEVLSLIYSNIAACELQYIKYKSLNDTEYKKHIDICYDYHIYSGYIRYLIVRITKKFYGTDSDKYKDALLLLAKHYHALATRYFYEKKYSDCIAIRSVLYTFYHSIGLENKAIKQLGFSPIDLFEKEGGNEKLFEEMTKGTFEEEKKIFKSFSINIPTYEDYKEIYEKYKREGKI